MEKTAISNESVKSKLYANNLLPGEPNQWPKDIPAGASIRSGNMMPLVSVELTGAVALCNNATRNGSTDIPEPVLHATWTQPVECFMHPFWNSGLLIPHGS